MCSGGRLLADFAAGDFELPDLPDIASPSLTQTVDGRWVVWAYKLARRQRDRYAPLSQGASYPADATAACRRGGRHHAPEPRCTCGFHALSAPWPGFPPQPGILKLDVALSGRVLVFEWQNGGLLFRAERQTVIRFTQTEIPAPPPRDDPEGRLARVPAAQPRGDGPQHLTLPMANPPVIAVRDDPGYCLMGGRWPATRSPATFATV